MKHEIGQKSGVGKLAVTRVSDDRVQLEIGKEKIIILTEDLATIVRLELPKDRAAELFNEIEEKAISRGKMRVQIVANRDIKQGEPVIFSVDVNKYLDKYGQPTGVRTNLAGFIH